jgi:hypothetical protein
VAAKATSATPRRRWNDDTIETELRAQIAALGHFPTRAELVASGLRGLWDAMRAGGGAEAWQSRLNGGEPAPSREAIAARAYELYERGAPGDHVEHWLVAERELGSGAR